LVSPYIESLLARLSLSRDGFIIYFVALNGDLIWAMLKTETKNELCNPICV